MRSSACWKALYGSTPTLIISVGTEGRQSCLRGVCDGLWTGTIASTIFMRVGLSIILPCNDCLYIK